jgi:type VII secretion integral membrane protein EccD
MGGTHAAPETGAASGVGSGFCRVQVAGPTTRVDLALPTAVPLAGLLPSIVAFAEQDAAAPQGWALSRLDGVRLDPAAALAAGGVREGELLLLHAAHDAAGEPLYDDVVEVLGADPADAGWTPRDTRVSCAVLATLAVLAVVAAVARVGTPLAGLTLGVLTLLLLGGGAAVAHAAGDVAAGTVAAALAAVSGAAFAVVLLGPPLGAAHLVVAAGVVVLAAATGPALVDGGDAVFLGLGITALHGLVGGVLVLVGEATPAQAAAVVGPLALALTTAMPTVALRLSRIPRPPLPRTAADLAEVPGQLELDQVLHRVRRARGLLSGLLVGCFLAATLAIVVLTIDTASTWSAVLAAVLAALVVLRARLLRHRAQVAAPLAAVGAVFAAGMAAAAFRGAPSGTFVLVVVVPIALLLAALAAAVGVWGGRHPLNPRLSRSLDLLETVLLLAVVPIGLAVWDVYTLLLEIRA